MHLNQSLQYERQKFDISPESNRNEILLKEQPGSLLPRQRHINIITNYMVSRAQILIACTDSAIIKNNNSDKEKHR